MAMRITSSMISGEYKKQMNTTLTQLDYYSKRANDLRNFRKFSEDPVTASKAMRLRRTYAQNADYQNNIKTIGTTYSMAESAASDIKDILDQAKEALQGTGSAGTVSKADLSIYATTLRGLQDDMITAMNSKLNDTYVFGGTDATKIPFTTENGQLLFRGQNVDTAADDILAKIANENIYIDIGLGVNVDKDGNVDEASVFNDKLNGLEFFGYGVDDKGYSNNIYNILGQAADAIEKYVAGDDSAYSTELASEFTGKVTEVTNNLLVSTANLGIKVNQLDSLSERLVNIQEDLNEQLGDLELVNAEEAYTDLTWQRYVYEASLQIGSKLLQTSFLDYMR